MRPESELIPYAPGRLTGSPMLVLAPHPDDEVFGCGGVLAQAARAGADVRVIIVTDGDAQGDPEIRRAESGKAARRLGVPEPEMWGFEDRSLDPSDPALLEKLRRTLIEIAPEVVLVSSPAEIHPDHRALALAVYHVLEEIGRSGMGTAEWDDLSLAAYEVSAVLRPNLLVDVSGEWAQLLKAAHAFGSQLDVAPYLEVYEAIRTIRRLTLPSHVLKAEAYHVVGMPFIREHSPFEWAGRQGPVAGLEGESGEVAALRSEIGRLQSILDQVYASRTWKLHRLLERIRGR